MRVHVAPGGHITSVLVSIFTEQTVLYSFIEESPEGGFCEAIFVTVNFGNIKGYIFPVLYFTNGVFYVRLELKF